MKKNLAMITSARGGLAHYGIQLYGPLQKYVNPFYITYADATIDDIVRENIDEVYPLIKNNDASSIIETLRFLEEKKISYINFHVATTARKYHMHYIALLSKARLAGIKVIGTIHDVMPFESFYINPSAIELLYSCMDHYIVGSEAESEKLQLYFQVPKDKITVINHGPYTIFNNHKFDQKTAQKQLGIPADKKVILFFGFLRPHKGLKYLIKAFKGIRKEMKDAWLYISTDLNYSPQLKELFQMIDKTGVADSVQLIKKYVPSSEIEPIFKAADVVVLPYTQVSQSGVLNIAYAFKKPVVVTDIFSEASMVENKFGKVAKKGDVDSLKNSITDLLSNPEKAKKYGLAAYEYAAKENSWENMAEKLNKIIENV